jgi:hypothetical protein
LKIRALLALVALAGLGLGGLVLWRRSAEYSRKAWIAENDLSIAQEYLEPEEEALRDEGLSRMFLEDMAMQMAEGGGKSARQREFLAMVARSVAEGTAHDRVATLAAFHRRRAAYYEARLAKYRHAARRPWLSVAADPPPPEIPAEFAFP